MNSRATLFRAVLVGSSAATAIVAVLIALIEIVLNATAPSSDAPALDAAVGFVILVVANLAIAATIGMAWHAFAQSQHWKSSHAYWPFGVLAGTLIPLLIALPVWNAQFEATSDLGRGFATFACPTGAVLGGLTALFAWFIRRPDRDTPANPASTTP